VAPFVHLACVWDSVRSLGEPERKGYLVSDTITVVGAGAMGGAIVYALASSSAFAASSIVVSEIDAARRDAVAAGSGATAGTRLVRDVADARVVVLAVKPQAFPTVASTMRPAIDPGQLVISIMAGVTVDGIESQLGSARIVRAMPNTPAQVGRGVTVWMSGRGVDTVDRQLTQQIVGTFGTEFEVGTERMIDAATAVHGSGPAYVYLVAEAWISAAVQIGLEPDLAERLVRETIAGSAELWAASGKGAAALRHAVTSPGGTTAAALDAFGRHDLEAAFAAAIQAAFRRSQQLG